MQQLTPRSSLFAKHRLGFLDRFRKQIFSERRKFWRISAAQPGIYMHFRWILEMARIASDPPL
jgi:hypothetical protein